MKKSTDTPYCLWNPYTQMDRFISYLGVGPSVLTHGEGHYIYNEREQRYINASSCTWNFSLGYGREEIIDAAERQMHEMPFSSCWSMAHPKAIELAAKLVEITSGNFSHVYLGSNGSEAVETALKMARQYHRQSGNDKDHNRFKFVSLRGSYHGYSYGAATLSGSEDYDSKFGPMLPGCVQIDPPYCYRCPYGKNGYPQCGLSCAHALEETILNEGPDSVAAFIVEPVMGEFGVVEPPADYFRIIGETCKKYGLLLIADEVTTGFGRTGKLFASGGWNPQPDILCLGKAISGGYLPLSATLTTEAVYKRFLGNNNWFKHGSTHSGHPVCAAVALAAIDIILKENLSENAARVGKYLKSRLSTLAETHPIIGEVRGPGLMLAVDLTKNRETKECFSESEIYDLLLDAVSRGLLVFDNQYGLSIFPPLNSDEALADEIVKIIDNTLHTGVLSDVERKARLLKEFVKARI